MVQGELFREENPLYKNATKPKSFLARYQISLSLDKVLMILIAHIAVFALIYSFGVEHGKRAMERHIETMFPAQIQTLADEQYKEPLEESSDTVLVVENRVSTKAPEVKENVSPSLLNEAEAEKSAKFPGIRNGHFTIQLVTYDKEDLAQKEVNRLKLNGLEGFVIPSGHYFQVCVNYFKDKSQARLFLKDFREGYRYPDAYIRPVVR